MSSCRNPEFGSRATSNRIISRTHLIMESIKKLIRISLYVLAMADPFLLFLVIFRLVVIAHVSSGCQGPVPVSTSMPSRSNSTVHHSNSTVRPASVEFRTPTSTSRLDSTSDVAECSAARVFGVLFRFVESLHPTCRHGGRGVCAGQNITLCPTCGPQFDLRCSVCSRIPPSPALLNLRPS